MCYQVITEKEGLPDDQVYNVFQDTKGFIWIATDAGLCRYDGIQFKSYSGRNMSSVAGSYIREDAWHRIWYANFDGFLYHTQGDSLIRWSTKLTEQPEYFLYQKQLQFAHKGNLLTYDLEKGTCVAKNNVAQSVYLFQHDSLVELGFFEKQHIELRTPQGHVLYEGKGANKNLFRVLPDAHDFLRIELLFPGYRIVSANTGNVIYSNHEAISLNACGINKNEIWVAHTRGCHLINKITGQVTLLAPEQICTAFLKDRHKNCWVGTNKGLFLYPSEMQVERTLLPGTHFKLQGFDNKIYGYNQTGQLVRIDTQHLEAKLLYENPFRRPYYHLLFNTNKDSSFEWFRNRQTNYLTTIQDQHIRIGLFNPGVKRFARLSSMYYVVASSMHTSLIRNTAQSKPDVWDSIFNSLKRKPTSHEPFSDISVPLQFSRSKWVVFDSTVQTAYFASSQGVSKLTPKGIVPLIYRGEVLFADEIIAQQGYTLLLLTNGSLLRMYRNAYQEIPSPIDISLGKQVHLHCFDSLIFIFDRSQIFVSSWNAVMEGKPVWKRVSFFGKTGSLQDILLFENNLYVSSEHEVIRFPFLNEAITPKEIFYLDGIQGRLEGRSYSNAEHEYKQGDIRIHFNVLDFYHQLPELSYRVNQHEWRDIPSTQRMLEFASLSPGNYRIQFKVNGVLQQAIASFIIRRPWYAQFWFYGLFIVLLLALVYLWYTIRLNRQQKENALLLEKSRLEKDLRQSMLSSIKSQMNPHFLFNALNTIQSYIITEDKDNASGYLAKFSRLTRKILDMSERDTIRLQEEIEALVLYIDLEKMRFNDLNYSIRIAPDVHTEQVHIPSMIIQPYVENAIKHGLLHKTGDKQVDLSFFIKNDMLCILITDNGIGRKRSEVINKQRKESHRSFAMQANKKRIELLNEERKNITVQFEDLYDELENAAGTKVLISVPIKNQL